MGLTKKLWLLSILVLAILRPKISLAQSDDPSEVGQHQLRESWLKARETPELLDAFKRQAFLVDLAEEGWWSLQIKHQTRPTKLSEDIPLIAAQSRALFASHPFQPQLWLAAWSHYLQKILERPWDGAREILSWLSLVSFPFLLALVLSLSFHLWTWHPAITQDLPHSLRSRSPLVVFSLLATALMFGFVTGNWVIVALVLLVPSVIYSRRPHFSIATLVFVIFAFVISPYVSTILTTMRELSAHEALHKGRTRIEYSPETLQHLHPLEKAIWADFNGDLLTAQRWLLEAPNSLETESARIYLGSKELAAPQLEPLIADLRQKYADDDILLYNHIQLSIQTQDLVKADELRRKLGEDQYKTLAVRANRMNRLLLPPKLETTSNRFWRESERRLSEQLELNGLYPFSPRKGIGSILALLLPWFFLLWTINRRRYSSGLCVHTGSATPSPALDTSPLYRSVIQRNDSMHAMRQQVDQMIRQNNQLQRRRANLWSWFIVDGASLLTEGIPTRSFWKSFMVFFMLWISFPDSIRQSLRYLCHMELAASSNFSPFSAGLFLIGLAIYFYLVLNSRKALSS